MLAELTRIDENEAGGLINYSFSSTAGLNNLTLLVHNVLNQNVATGPNAGTGNGALGNFTITYANGVTVTDALASIGSVANIGSSSEFDVSGTDGEPNGIDNAFNSSNLLTATTDAALYDTAAQGATAGTYLYNTTSANPQGSGLISFGDASANGGITDVSFTWVSSINGGNTAFLGFAGTAVVPEPSSTALLGLGGLAFILRRRR